MSNFMKKSQSRNEGDAFINMGSEQQDEGNKNMYGSYLGKFM